MLEQSRILFAISQSQSIFSNVHLSVKILIRLVTLTQHILIRHNIYLFNNALNTFINGSISARNNFIRKNTNNRGSLMWIDLKVGTCTTGLQ